MAPLARETARLRFGRTSVPRAHYFITFCTKDRVRALNELQCAAGLIEILRLMHEAEDIGLIAATIMPDHVHLLFALGVRLRVGQVIGKIKSLSGRLSDRSWRWQNESFEHQLRPRDSLEDYAFYIFMNPYRARLCRLDERWPWWICHQTVAFRFLSYLGQGSPMPKEWIERSREIASRIAVRR